MLHFRRILVIFLLVALPLSTTSQKIEAGDISHTSNPDAGLSNPGFISLLQAPTLKWQYGGCYSSWCETGWYSSPAVHDLDGDGQAEVIASAYSIFVLNGSTGELEWQMASGHDINEPEADPVGRTWPGIALADTDNDGAIEIITAHSGGYVSVYKADGTFEPGWPQRPTERELRGLAVSDLDGDGTLEIVVNAAIGSHTNTWVYEHDGALRPGWPRLSDESGYAWGVYNANTSIADLDNDGAGEIVVPSDVHYVCAYEADGAQIPAHTMYGDKGWGKVGVWEDLQVELRGWGECNGVRSESYRPNFAHGPSAIADMNGDGVYEVVVVGNVYDCSQDPYLSRYNGPYIFNADRSRFNKDGFYWQNTPWDSGAPLSEDYGVIENAQPNPAIADLDGDGLLEILFASYDGRMHAYWLDKSEHGNWPYSVYNPAEGFFRFASEPAIADLDADGLAEVIFASWTQHGSNQTGKLHILDYLGNPLHTVDLPSAYGGPDWNGALAAPTLANLDSDADLEVVLNTAHSGVVAFDLPGTANARPLWATGRGNYLRNASLPLVPEATLAGSQKLVTPPVALPGEQVSFTLHLHNPGKSLTGVSLVDQLPPELSYTGNLYASSGSAQVDGNTITWQGAVERDIPVTISFTAQVSQAITGTLAIRNTAEIEDGQGNTWEKSVDVVVNGLPYFLPIIRR